MFRKRISSFRTKDVFNEPKQWSRIRTIEINNNNCKLLNGDQTVVGNVISDIIAFSNVHFLKNLGEDRIDFMQDTIIYLDIDNYGRKVLTDNPNLARVGP